MVSAMRRMTSSRSLSCCRAHVCQSMFLSVADATLNSLPALEGRERTLMSSNTHTCSFPGSAMYSSKSLSRGRGSCGSASVRSVDRYSQSQSMTFSFFPKQRSNDASCCPAKKGAKSAHHPNSLLKSKPGLEQQEE